MKLRQVDGVFYKYCPGSTHDGGTWVPVSRFWKRRNGLPRPQCMTCETVMRGSEHMVPVSRILPFLRELITRLGKAETARRLGSTQHWIWKVINGKQKSVQRQTARNLISTLHEVRSAGEVRHRASIMHGAAQRGKNERVPRRRDEFYKPFSNDDATQDKINRSLLTLGE